MSLPREVPSSAKAWTWSATRQPLTLRHSNCKVVLLLFVTYLQLHHSNCTLVIAPFVTHVRTQHHPQ